MANEQHGNPPATDPAAAWEQGLPEIQTWLNRFCENWIFAFLVAMIIRHFFIEAYRIPTASMEPMLYGDVRMMHADHVVVDKVSARFVLPKRFEPTVFQFPWPEIMTGGAETVAFDGEGQRLDHPLFHPLIHRNFVKRCLVLPGDEFYFAHGDLFLKVADGSFQVAAKPPEVQEALWQEIYQLGADPDYCPWQAGSGEPPSVKGGMLMIAGGQTVRFTQPLRNLYVKPGPVRVAELGRGEDEAARARNAEERLAKALQFEVSMIRPCFNYDNRRGNIWDLDSWQVARITGADLDRGTYGTRLNDQMKEYVGDLRLRFALARLDGSLRIRLEEQSCQTFDLALSQQGWRLLIDGVQVAQGQEAVLGADWWLANVDDRLSLGRDGKILHTMGVKAADPNTQRSAIGLEGDAPAHFKALSIDRDVHYCTRGFLDDETATWEAFETSSDLRSQALCEREQFKLMKNRRMFIETLIDPALRQRLLASLDLAEQRRSSRRRVTDLEFLKPLGGDPAHAFKAPAGAYLMLGDNSPFSWDGRNWGWVPEANLRGRVMAVILPFSRWRVVR